METTQYEERALNKQELAQHQEALKWARTFVDKFDKTATSFTPKLLDDTFEKLMQESWWKRPKEFQLIMGLGVALGEYMVNNMGFEWIIYRDIEGKDMAVKHQQSDIISFPISAVRKRFLTKEFRFMQDFVDNIKNELLNMPKILPTIHYISQAQEGLSHLEAIQNACEAGCQWVQLRLKNSSFDDYLTTAIAAKKICQQHGVLLTINDNPTVALESGADGLHLGKEDMAPSAARKIVGDLIIGGTANNWEDILRLSTEGVDYIGLGPFAFTTTKEKLSPVLGIEGFSLLLNKMKEENIKIPVLAIGGIQLEDIEPLMNTGVYGVAVSGLITNSINKKSLCKKMEDLIRNEN